MNEWQDMVAVSLIAGASAYLVRLFWRRATKLSPGCCDTCRRCPTPPGTDDPVGGGINVVEVSSPTKQPD